MNGDERFPFDFASAPGIDAVAARAEMGPTHARFSASHEFLSGGSCRLRLLIVTPPANMEASCS